MIRPLHNLHPYTSLVSQVAKEKLPQWTSKSRQKANELATRQLSENLALASRASSISDLAAQFQREYPKNLYTGLTTELAIMMFSRPFAANFWPWPNNRGIFFALETRNLTRAEWDQITEERPISGVQLNGLEMQGLYEDTIGPISEIDPLIVLLHEQGHSDQADKHLSNIGFDNNHPARIIIEFENNHNLMRANAEQRVLSAQQIEQACRACWTYLTKSFEQMPAANSNETISQIDNHVAANGPIRLSSCL